MTMCHQQTVIVFLLNGNLGNREILGAISPLVDASLGWPHPQAPLRLCKLGIHSKVRQGSLTGMEEIIDPQNS